MEGFLDYLNDFNQTQTISKPKKQIDKNKEIISKPKVLCMNVEIRTVDGAQKVIAKLNEWIAKQEQKEHFELKETTEIVQKPKIQPKKVITNPIVKSRNHAVDILEGISDDIKIVSPEKNINNKEEVPPSKETVSSHASMLL